MCCSHIGTLKPKEVPLQLQDDEEAKKVLKSIERYNRLFVGGAWGFFLKLYDLPLLLQRMFHEMTDPTQIDRHVHSWRLLAVESLSALLTPNDFFVLGFSYMISPLKFMPDGVNVMAICNLAALFMVTLIKISGLFQRRRSAENVRRLAALETPAGA